MNQGWIYQAMKKLNEQGLIHFSEGKPFEAGRLLMPPLGSLTLRCIKDLAQRVREIQRNSLECIGEEDCI